MKIGNQRVAGLQPEDAFEHRPRARHVPLRQKLIERLRIHLTRNAWDFEQRLDLGSEGQKPRVAIVIKGLDYRAGPAP
jgi:hypothetical protein